MGLNSCVIFFKVAYWKTILQVGKLVINSDVKYLKHTISALQVSYKFRFLTTEIAFFEN